MIDLEKRCSICDRIKPLTEFHRDAKASGGKASACKSCVNEGAKRSKARRRAAMGEEAWLAYQREILARSRQRTGNVKGKRYTRAVGRAQRALAKLHPAQYERLLAIELRRIEDEDRT